MDPELNLGPLWMPFTANRDFKNKPRLLAAASGHHYTALDGRKIYDGFSGLWTSGLGHCHPAIVQAVQHQVQTLDFSMSFQMGHPRSFELADKLTQLAPQGFDHCFFTNSGSESVDTALKIALAWHRRKGNATRSLLVGRERGYHGVNFGGISVGGIAPNRISFSANLLPHVDHLPHTHDLEHNAFSHGQPSSGAHLADALDRLVALHGAENIAAVIVEPVPGSTGVLPPPLGYLERLREISTRHGILLIFDEVITGFGRLGTPFASDYFGITPDIITTAKGLTNGVIPMGAVLVRSEIFDAFMHQSPDYAVEFFHGYTYSGHPVASAAACAALDTYAAEGTFDSAKALAPTFEAALHSLAACPNVIDVRNIGLMGAIELAPRPGAPGLRGLDAHKACFWDENLVIRNAGDILQFAPFLNANPDDLTRMFESVGRVLHNLP